MVNDAGLADLALDVAGQLAGAGRAVRMERPYMFAEDFAFMAGGLSLRAFLEAAGL